MIFTKFRTLRLFLKMISNVAVVLKFLVILFAITQIQSGHLVEGPNAENQCGVSLSASGLMYNGKVVKRSQWPFLVVLMYTADGKFFCGGTLISRSHVLTAAHCLQEKSQETPLTPSEFVLHLGKYNLSALYERGSITVFPEKIKIHPNWNIHQEKYDSDIALIKIVGNVPLRSNIYPACLWTSALEMKNAPTGTVIGWGATEDQLTTQNQLIPRQIELKIVTNEVCYEDEFMGSLISSRTFCAIGENGSGPCKGDSGGGSYMKDNSKWFIKGIFSSSLFTDEGMCDVERYSIFTDVSKFSNWIAKEMDIETDMTCKAYETKLKYIQRSDFSGFQFLTIIIMAKNEIVNIPADTFYDVPGLELLNLHGNQIASFDVDLFIKSPKLVEFFAYKNQIEYLDGRLFRKNFYLEEIHMDFNKLKHIDVELFTPLERLISADFRHNTCISEYFPETKDFESFKAIIVTNCSI
ncbi:CLUMA_CG016552, isoform B [Clunio marinus]|uniref:CLUMA_CG016552, isoform B n=1 Tax=Clunio marinus TaxID=568069 RepID=A0A1J1IU27_9DIPT|nr:CLUMA_CG016552, isoform B [Clunio marinus]